MENFLSNFANTNTEVTSSNAKISINPEFWGAIDITKGALKMNVHFYARTCQMTYENCVSLEDWDVNDRTDISFSGVLIDDLGKLKTTLINSGLTTVANGLNISDDDIKKQICIQISESKNFKDVFGKKAFIFDILSNEEKNKITLKYVIDNFDKMSLNNHHIREFLITHEEGYKVMPTIEQLKEMYNNLKIN